MQPVDMELDQIESVIVAFYQGHLMRTGLLTQEQVSEQDYSFVIPELNPSERPDSEEREKKFRRFALDQFEFSLTASKELLHRKLCTEAQYCKNKTNEGLNIVVTTLDGILIAIIGYPVPAVTVMAWLIKTKWLDKLCACTDP